MLFRLAVIAHNPLAEGVIATVGVVILALVAVMVVGVWIAVARGSGRRSENASDEGLQNLRRRRLVVLPSRKARGPQAAVVSELEPDGDSEPAAR